MNEIAKTTGQEIASLIVQGIESWIQAGKLLVEALDNGSTLNELADESGVSKDILSRFEQVGRNALYPKLLASTSPGANALKICGYSEQKEFCENPVTLVVCKNGTFDNLLVNVDALTSHQAKQVFTRGHVRSEAEQRAYLEDVAEVERKKKINEIEDSAGYIIKGNKVMFKKNVTISKDELIKILGKVA